MAWRVALTVGYTAALVAAAELKDVSDDWENVLGALVIAAPVVGFVVGRPWVLLAVVGPVIARLIGYDPAQNDGVPALDAFRISLAVVSFGLWIGLGLGLAYIYRWWEKRNESSPAG